MMKYSNLHLRTLTLLQSNSTLDHNLPNPQLQLLINPQIAISLFTALILLWSARLQLKNQRLQINSTLTTDYFYVIHELRAKVGKEGFTDRMYYHRYWRQLYREFNAWCNGDIDDRTYIRWLKQEKKEYQLNEPPNNINLNENYKFLSYQQGFDFAKDTLFRRVLDDSFFAFMKEVFDVNSENDLYDTNMKNTLKKYQYLKKKWFFRRGSNRGNKKERAPVAVRMEVHLSIQQPWTRKKTYP